MICEIIFLYILVQFFARHILVEFLTTYCSLQHGFLGLFWLTIWCLFFSIYGRPKISCKELVVVWCLICASINSSVAKISVFSIPFSIIYASWCALSSVLGSKLKWYGNFILGNNFFLKEQEGNEFPYWLINNLKKKELHQIQKQKERKER